MIIFVQCILNEKKYYKVYFDCIEFIDFSNL